MYIDVKQGTEKTIQLSLTNTYTHRTDNIIVTHNHCVKSVRIQSFTGPYTGQNAIISSNFLVWKFCGKAQFPHSFGRFARNYAETVPFHEISTPGN